MFLFHASFSLALLALTAGIALYVWSLRAVGAGTGLAKILGFLIMIVALLGVLCTGYCGVRYWQAGYFQSAMEEKCKMCETVVNKTMPDGKTADTKKSGRSSRN